MGQTAVSALCRIRGFLTCANKQLSLFAKRDERSGGSSTIPMAMDLYICLLLLDVLDVDIMPCFVVELKLLAVDGYVVGVSEIV